MLRYLLLLCGCVASPFTAANDSTPYRPRQVLRKPIRPITDPPIVSADKAEIAPNELVIGVEVEGTARAYSINQLTGPQREIINDELGGSAIAATW